jgi:hypothetical protein
MRHHRYLLRSATLATLRMLLRLFIERLDLRNHRKRKLIDFLFYFRFATLAHLLLCSLRLLVVPLSDELAQRHVYSDLFQHQKHIIGTFRIMKN